MEESRWGWVDVLIEGQVTWRDWSMRQVGWSMGKEVRKWLRKRLYKRTLYLSRIFIIIGRA